MQCNVTSKVEYHFAHALMSVKQSCCTKQSNTITLMAHNLHLLPRSGSAFVVMIMLSYSNSSIILLLNELFCAVLLRTHVVPARHYSCLIACFLVLCRIWTCRLRWLQRLEHHWGRRANLWLPPLESHPASAGCRSAAWPLTMWLQETLPLLCDYSTGTCCFLQTILSQPCHFKLNPEQPSAVCIITILYNSHVKPEMPTRSCNKKIQVELDDLCHVIFSKLAGQ